VQTLERSYLLKVNGTVVERPQHMLMRVAVSTDPAPGLKIDSPYPTAPEEMQLCGWLNMTRAICLVVCQTCR
jgi:hypothetical protein